MAAETITRDAMAKSVAREIKMRARVYPKWVALGKMKQADADHEIACMRQVHLMLGAMTDIDVVKFVSVPLPADPRQADLLGG